MMKTALLVSLTAATVLTLENAPTRAQPQTFATACAVDVKLQCAGVRAGEGRIRACLREHAKDLSESCRDFLAGTRARARACAADAKKLCADVKPGGGRIGKCLKEHLDGVSAPCRDALTQGPANE